MGHSVPSLDDVGIKADDGLAESFRKEVARLLERGSTGFPGAQPVSFARHHLNDLKSRDYWVCEKSDGIRCLLYFTRGDEGEEIHYLIDRKNDYYFVPGLHFPHPAPEGRAEPEWDSFHTDTILDGELVNDAAPGGPVLKYLVFDCLVLDGASLMDRTLDKRLAYFMERVHAPYAMLCRRFPDDAALFRFKLEKKSFQLAYGTEMVFKDILPNLPHGNDGLIFTCKETPYKFGTDENILKWKPADENTIDFKLGLEFPPRSVATNGTADGADADGAIAIDDDDDADDGEGVWEYDYDALPRCTLYAHHREHDDRPYAPLHLTVDEWAALKAWSVAHADGLDGQVVECRRDAEGRWRFNRVRDDKRDGNHVSVVEKVLESIRDGVSRDELIAAAADVKAAWKRRDAERRRRDEERRRRAGPGAPR